MSIIVDILILAGVLLAIVAVVQVAAARLVLPESTLLSAIGIAIGAGYVAIDAAHPDFARHFLHPLIDPALPPEAYLWIFLPPLLFHAALTADVRGMLPDAAPILLLAVVAVVVATGVIGVATAAASGMPLAVCLLLGAVVATTDPAAVIAIFRDVGAPARLIRLVEGESLLNDAAAIAIVGVLVAMLTGHGAQATLAAGLRELAWAFVGGVLCGALAGRLVSDLLPRLAGLAMAESALTLALPYPLYLLAEQLLGVSGVVAVVCAGLMVSALGPTRLAPPNWRHLRMMWEQFAGIAGAVVFLLAAVRVPSMLAGVTGHHGWLLLALVLAALAARLLTLFGLLPLLSWLRLSAPIDGAFKLAIAWGGLRGAVTLVLALGIAENSDLPYETRHFVAILATGFVLVSLLLNGTTLRALIHRLGLDQLSPQERALQLQAIRLSTEEVEAMMARVADSFDLPPAIAREAAQKYRHGIELGSAEFDFDTALSERDRLSIGLVTLATRERELIPEYGDGVISVANLDAMMRNTAQMIDAAREQGRIGYNRAARHILDYHLGFRVALFLHRRLGIDRPLARALADRFELLICRQTVLDRLRRYNRSMLTPVFGARMATVLDGVLEDRSRAAAEGLADMRGKFGAYTVALERRLLMLFALRKGRLSLEAMREEAVISKEAFNQIAQVIQQAWNASLVRPPLRGVTEPAGPAWRRARPQGGATGGGSGRVFGAGTRDGRHDADAEHDQAGNADIDRRQPGRRQAPGNAAHQDQQADEI
ncbi:cation:proton antiporter [Cupriavidus alkaliphilus]|uniref:cation:proton antiporter n=1 Tax=Cupriavidus alkaliphilus TaxID=942866 RepID=UPI001607F3AE|nr:cation:proton antiporter [Cupriavidus alkaliphilus]MBB3012871.1 CPA1 family monovalent cation:H+ antiporter [Cupriavidus alkaliphilus]